MNFDFISIGCDPELFAKRKGRFISVHEIFPGTKSNPSPVPFGAVQVDGVAAEFNITPAKTVEDFVHNITKVTEVMHKIINNTSDNVTLLAVPTATFGKKYFESLPFSAKALGCEPDYSAYTKRPNPKPETTLPFRTGSGHVHVQTRAENALVNDLLDSPHFDDCCKLVEEFDVSLYPASKFWDKDEQRMELYGKPGAFRPKVYGLEYRTLSNAWLGSVDTMKYVFEATKETTKRWLLNEKESLSSLFKLATPKDTDAYESFLSVNGLPTPSDFGIKAI